MKTNLLLIVPGLILVTSLCAILIDGQRDTRDRGLKVTPDSAPPDDALTVVAEGTVSDDSDHDLQQNVIRVEGKMAKTDEAHLRELGFNWLLDDGPTGFRDHGWSQGSDSLNLATAEQPADDRLPDAPQQPRLLEPFKRLPSP